MAVLRAKQKEVEAIEAMLAKMMEELKVRLAIMFQIELSNITLILVSSVFLSGG